jgi:hypothetical protein
MIRLDPPTAQVQLPPPLATVGGLDLLNHLPLGRCRRWKPIADGVTPGAISVAVSSLPGVNPSRITSLAGWASVLMAAISRRMTTSGGRVRCFGF